MIYFLIIRKTFQSRLHQMVKIVIRIKFIDIINVFYHFRGEEVICWNDLKEMYRK